MDDPVVFLDTETISLESAPDVIWEVGLIKADGTEHHWFLPVDLGRADPIALKIGRFYERSPQLSLNNPEPLTPLVVFAAEFAKLTAGKHLVGAVISFDEERLRKLLRANGACPDWKHRVRCVETLTAGHLRREVGGLRDCAEALGVAFPEDEAHTALGDARVAKAIYEAVIGK